MQGAKDLIASERGWFVLVVLVAATALVVLNKITGTEWKTLVLVLGGMLVASKTGNSMIDQLTNKESA